MSIIFIIGFIFPLGSIVKATASNSAAIDIENSGFSQTASNSSAGLDNSSYFTAEVFIHKNFTGNSTTINENVPIIKGQFQDSISSLIISTHQNQNSRYMVEVCEHKHYAGNCMILGPGKHNVQTLGWLNDQISSIRYLSPHAFELKNVSSGVLMNGSI